MIDHRPTLTQVDIMTIRKALREAIFAVKAPPADMAKFRALLKKLKGHTCQPKLGFRGTSVVGQHSIQTDCNYLVQALAEKDIKAVDFHIAEIEVTLRRHRTALELERAS